MGERVKRRGREALHTGQRGAQAAPHLREGKRLRESVARRRIRGGARQQAVRGGGSEGVQDSRQGKLLMVPILKILVDPGRS